MKVTRLLACAVAVAGLVGATAACIEALTLDQMVSRTDTCVRGTITKVETTRSQIDDTDWARIFTVITVEGEDLYSGKQVSMDMAFMGGTHKGITEAVSTMPDANDYRVGNKVVAFSAAVESWGTVERCLYATYGGIYREVQTRKGAVILGRGKDFAIESNMTITALQAGIKTALDAKSKEVK